jgi:hypothetical protein
VRYPGALSRTDHQHHAPAGLPGEPETNHPLGKKQAVILSLPVVLLFGVLMFLLIRKGGMKLSHGLIAMAFGFYLASTELAPQINTLNSTIANLLDSVHP